MNADVFGNCTRSGCARLIPPGLVSEQLCLDHFLDEAFVRNERAFQLCSQGQPLDSNSIEWLLSDALAIVKNLEEGADQPNPDQRDRMLELLLIVANLQEYVAHHSTQVQRLA
jgi:hypothetical protein